MPAVVKYVAPVFTHTKYAIPKRHVCCCASIPWRNAVGLLGRSMMIDVSVTFVQHVRDHLPEINGCLSLSEKHLEPVGNLYV